MEEIEYWEKKKNPNPKILDFKRGAQERGGVTSNETARPLVSLKRTKPTSVKVAPADSKPTSGEKPTVSPQGGQRAQGADQNFQVRKNRGFMQFILNVDDDLDKMMRTFLHYLFYYNSLPTLKIFLYKIITVI